MRHSAVLLGALLIFGLRAEAQWKSPDPPPLSLSSTASLSSPAINLPDAPNPSFAAEPLAEPFAAALPAKPEPAPAPEPQEVQGVYGEYYTQVFIGYTYYRFWKLPSTQISLDGVDVSMATYLKPWAAADIEVFDTVGSDGGKTANMFFFGGGPRVRWQTTKGFELWAHGLGGFTHYSPSTIYGYPTGPAFEVGGGVDISRPHKRWGYRLQGDMVGTFLFGVHQYSPRVSAGLVFQF